MPLIPEDWMPACEMQRIICHWTAGGYEASEHDKECYHILIERDGTLVRGDHPISDNVSTADDDYAAHTQRCNTKAIGVSVFCMANAKENPFNGGASPMTEGQWETMAQVVAELARRYRIEVTPRTVLGHGEVQARLGILQNGKWDPMKLPWMPALSKEQVGDRFRARVSELMAAVPVG